MVWHQRRPLIDGFQQYFVRFNIEHSSTFFFFCVCKIFARSSEVKPINKV